MIPNLPGPVKLFILVVIGGLCFATGRFTSPTKTVEVVKTVTVEKENSQLAKLLDLEAMLRSIKDATKANNVRRETTTTKSPDGTVTSHTVVDDKSTSTTKTDTTGTTTIHTETEYKLWRETVRTEERIKLVENLKPPEKWMFDVFAGGSVPGFLGRDVPNYIPGLPKQFFVGTSFSRKMWGPLWGGAGLTSRGDLFLRLAVKW